MEKNSWQQDLTVAKAAAKLHAYICRGRGKWLQSVDNMNRAIELNRTKLNGENNEKNS